MINNYQIRQNNNEEILYLYFDFDMEIGSFSDGNNKSLLSKINEYIKNKKIIFNGKKMVLIVSGVVVASLLLNNNYKYNNNYVYVSKILVNNSPKNSLVLDDFIEYNNYDFTKVVNLNYKEPIKEKNKLNDNTNEIVKNGERQIINTNEENIDVNSNSELNNGTGDPKIKKPNISNDVETKEKIIEKNMINNDASNVVEKNDNNSQVTNPILEELSKEEPKQMITLYRNNSEIITMDIEEYLVGVVAGEMPALFDIEALKAQSVVSRTYTLKQLSLGKRITDSLTQNYKTNDELRIKWGSDYDKYYKKIKEAVNATKGVYITYNGVVIDAVFSCVTNGYTEDAINTWGYSIPYLKSVDSSWDIGTSYYSKITNMNYEEISSKLGFVVTSETDFEILERNSSNRVTSVKVAENFYSGTEFRGLLGLASTDFEIIKADTGLTFNTKGYGHGVGMSQYGANGLAKNGYNYEYIIKYYYNGVNLESN